MSQQYESIRGDSVALAKLGTLRFLTCGSVDDGKSTLIGRLLHDSQSILDDQMRTLKTDSKAHGTIGDDIDFALLVDGLEIERDQGITIDVAYRYFKTPNRSFIVADTPGHEQYTRNMATGASNSELAIVLIDARKGVLVQTKRHAYICSLLGIRHIFLAVNKIDLVNFDEAIFAKISSHFAAFAEPLGFETVTAVPVSARHGDNVASKSQRTPWYQGRSLIALLEAIDVSTSRTAAPFRFPVQRISRPHLDFRGFCGNIVSGQISCGDEVVSALTGRASTVSRIVTYDGDIPFAASDTAVTVVLADEIDIARGDVLTHKPFRPEVSTQFAAHVLWLSDEPVLAGRSYQLRIGCQWSPASVTAIKHKIDVDTLNHLAATHLGLNEIGYCNLATTLPVAFDAYSENRDTGSFILVDRFSNATVAAGMITFGLRRATNIHIEEMFVDKAARAAAKHQKPTVIWFTGLSGSGKSTIAKRLEQRLHESGHHTYVLDGDNVRQGLNRDIGFTDADRVENIRRIGEVAKLFADAGLIVLCSFISPFRAERAMVRELLEPGEFIEIFVDASLAVCRSRDPKGLYAKAAMGKIKNFTGIDSPYEFPENPDLHLLTDSCEPDELVERILKDLHARGRV